VFICRLAVVINRLLPDLRVATGPRLPQSEPTKEGMVVAATAAPEGHQLQLLGVSAADDDVIEEQCGREPFHPECNGIAPLLLPELPESASSQVVLDRPFSVREGSEFHRHDVSAHH